MQIPRDLWPAVSEAFDRAQDWPAGERVQRLAAERPEVAVHLQRLLAAQETGGTLTPADGALAARALAEAAQGLAPGRVVGIYRLLHPLGQGGMSSVWAAEQLEGVPRRVALKLPHPGLEPPAALAARFARERDLLAGLEHPGIARLYDAGIDGGQPYLAMALVEGEPLTRHAAARPQAERLDLFMQVLEAVGFAHRRLVIHRDLKPANILVTAEGRVQLLDFGIARLLDDDSAEAGAAALTPDGASPEQLAGQRPLGVASDVYALGVVLYELLAGQRPYRLDPASAVPLAAQLAALTVEPPSRHGGAALAGDLDAIVMRALARDPVQRYPDVEALADDLRRHRAQRPVAARGGGRRYRWGLALRRQRGAVAGGLATLLALVGGLGVALWQGHEARQQAERVAATQQLLVRLFEGAAPGGEGAAETRRVILAGSARMDAELSAQPRLQADLRRLSGELLLRLQAWQPAAERLQAALAAYDRLGLAERPDAITARMLLAEALQNDHQHAAARAAAEAVIAAAEAGVDAARGHATWARLVRASAIAQDGDAEQGIAATRAALALAPAAGEDRPRLALVGLAQVGLALWDQGRIDEARHHAEAVIAAAEVVPGFPRTDLVGLRYRRLAAVARAGDFEAARQAAPALVAEAEAVFGPAATTTVWALELQAQVLARLGRGAESVAVQRDVVARVASRPSADDEQLAASRGMLGQLLVAAGRVDEGLPLVLDLVRLLDAKYPTVNAYAEQHRLAAGAALPRAGRLAEARATLQMALSRLQGLPGGGGAWVPEVEQALALAEHLAGRRAEARGLVARACAGLVAAFGEANPRALRCRTHQAWMDGLAGEPGARAAFESSGAAYAAGLPAGHVVGAELDLMRADLLASSEPAAAREMRAQGQRRWTQALGLPAPERFTGLH